MLTPDLLQLHSIQLILLFLLFAHHFCLSDLHFALEVDLIDLVLVQSFEVVWLYAMWSQHAHLRLRILSHEIVVIGKIKLVLFLLVPQFALFLFAFLLFGIQDVINIVGVNLVLFASFVVLILSLLQNVIEFNRLLVEQVVNVLLKLLL